MIKFKSLPSLIQVYYTLHSLFSYKPAFKKAIHLSTRAYRQQVTQINPTDIQNIKKITMEGFQDKKCLARWGEVSDIQFGGTSFSEVAYNEYLKIMSLAGKIDVTNKDKLQTVPFIGMLQKTPFTFKVGIYNALRVQLMGDGHPIHCQINFFSPIQGTKSAHAFILTQKHQNWVTYELPFRNFQMKGEQVTMQSQLHSKSRQTVARIIDQQCYNPQQFSIQNISFRLISTTNIVRKIHFKKIQLVKTKRGTLKYSNLYYKPYFYIVDQNQQKDVLLDAINTGMFTFTKKK